jgi:hypothetical protein
MIVQVSKLHNLLHSALTDWPGMYIVQIVTNALKNSKKEKKTKRLKSTKRKKEY